MFTIKCSVLHKFDKFKAKFSLARQIRLEFGGPVEVDHDFLPEDKTNRVDAVHQSERQPDCKSRLPSIVMSLDKIFQLCLSAEKFYIEQKNNNNTVLHLACWFTSKPEIVSFVTLVQYTAEIRGIV